LAEADVSHDSESHPGALRLTTYMDRPIRMVVEPGDHLRESRWDIRATLLRGWPDG
jgi:hypothetical protein